jgi:hypothetical protein
VASQFLSCFAHPHSTALESFTSWVHGASDNSVEHGSLTDNQMVRILPPSLEICCATTLTPFTLHRYQILGITGARP